MAFAGAVVVNIALASLGYLQLLLLFLLFVPAGIFARAVREVTKEPDADSASDGSAPPGT